MILLASWLSMYFVACSYMLCCRCNASLSRWLWYLMVIAMALTVFFVSHTNFITIATFLYSVTFIMIAYFQADSSIKIKYAYNWSSFFKILVNSILCVAVTMPLQTCMSYHSQESLMLNIQYAVAIIILIAIVSIPSIRQFFLSSRQLAPTFIMFIYLLGGWILMTILMPSIESIVMLSMPFLFFILSRTNLIRGLI